MNLNIDAIVIEISTLFFTCHDQSLEQISKVTMIDHRYNKNKHNDWSYLPSMNASANLDNDSNDGDDNNNNNKDDNDNNKDDNDNNKDDNDNKGNSALELDRSQGISQGHQGYQ